MKQLTKTALKDTERIGSIVYWSAWSIIAVCHYLILRYIFVLPFVESVLDSFYYNLSFAFIGRYMIYQVRFLSLDNYSPLNLILIHSMAGLIVSSAWVYGIRELITYSVQLSEDYSFFLEKSSWFRIVIGYLFYLQVIVLYYLIEVYNEWRRNIDKEKDLNSMLKDAELKALKYQINPHFIFNSLNSIASMCYSNSKHAAEMTIKLAGFLRSTFKRNEEQMVSLEEEIATVEQYIQIERIRYSDRLAYKINIDPQCRKVPVPTMILQPLIENAIKHGVHESTETIRLHIDCKMQANQMEIEVGNTYDNTAVSPKAGEGLGLTATKERLYKSYSQENLLTIQKTKYDFTVRIRIPIKSTKVSE